MWSFAVYISGEDNVDGMKAKAVTTNILKDKGILKQKKAVGKPTALKITIKLLRLLADVSKDTTINVKNVTVYSIRSFRSKEYCRTS